MNLEPLRQALLSLKPSGKDGFEGLLAFAFSRITGNPMRLAASGFQFGVDGQGEIRNNPICFEAKRYDSNLGRETVLTKILDLSRRQNEAEILWILGATTEVQNQLVQDLQAVGAKEGIATLVLDWNDQSLPSLGVALANAGDEVIDWIEARTSSDRVKLKTIMEFLRDSPKAKERWKLLEGEFSAQEVSMRYTIAANKDWLSQALTSAKKARLHLGQPTAPKQTTMPVLPRPELKEEVSKALTDATTCIVLGTEGVGKSWIAAEIAHEFLGCSIILSAEKFEGLRTTEINSLLAEEFSRQALNADKSIVRWKRRLQAWEASPSREGFLLVVDGINQRPSEPWDKLLVSLEAFVEDRGGKLIVTTRPRYFSRSVQKGFNPKHVVSIPDWIEDERDQILDDAGIEAKVLDDITRKSLLNPRLLGIALSVLPHDDLTAWEGLTVPALLFEHVRRTQVDGFEDQSPEELCRQLSRDAGRLLDQQTESKAILAPHFDEEEILAVKETRFFKTIEGPSDGYRLVEEGLTLALGFAVIDRLWPAHWDPKELHGRIEALLEPIAALDETSRVVLAAMHICAFDPERDNAALFEALVAAFSDLQNLDDGAYQQFFNVVRQKPSPTFEAAKSKLLDWRTAINEKWLVATVAQLFRETDTKPAAAAAIKEWLLHLNINAADQRNKYGRQTKDEEERIASRQKEIDEAIRQFSRDERAHFDLCRITCGDTDSLITQALELLAEEPLAPWAKPLTVLGIGFHLDHTVHSARKAFGHLTQFNRKDPVEAGKAFLIEVGPFRSPDTSRGGKWTLVRMLYATGQRDHALEAGTIAAELRKEMSFPDFGGTRLEKLCATDPCDPLSVRPENLAETKKMYASLDSSEIRKAMSSSMEDHNWQDALCAMSRFEPELAILKNKEICKSILTRDGMPLRQLVLNETSLSPLMERSDALALSQRLQSGDGFKTIEADSRFAECFALLFALHQLTGDEQLELMTSDRVSGNYSLDCVPALKQPSETLVLSALDEALKDEKHQAAFGILTLVAHTYETLSPKLEDGISRFLPSENSLVRASVFEVAINTKNDHLRKLHLDGTWCSGDVVSANSYESIDGSYLLIEAVALGEIDFEDISKRISLEAWYHAIARLGDPAAETFLRFMDRRLMKALEGIHDVPKPTIEVSMKPHDLASHSFRSAEIIEPVQPRRDPLSILSETESDEDFRKHQKRIHRLFNDLEAALSENDIQIISENFDFDVLKKLLIVQPELNDKWHHMLLQLPLSDLAWFKDVALVVANVTMRTDEQKGLSLMTRAASVQAFVKRMYPDGLYMVHKAIWSCPRTPMTEELWKTRLQQCDSDDHLASEVLAAERFGDKSYILQFVNENLASERPIDIALAITVAGFSVQTDAFAKLFSTDSSGYGFLAEATQSAGKAHERAVWTEHWLEKMWNADTPKDFWLNHNLMARIIDARTDYGSGIFDRENRWHAFSTLFTRSRSKRIEKWQKDRKKKLYGNEKPDDVFLPWRSVQKIH